ncbi:MAG: hypothetical protein BAJALOKI1v1_1290002 [Promethearchaeota archaeon]|nr:MAG: hypothetical protein BAJALOKI1v1_1290002 [Candidatus Lokiarchaeota archaeon]
MIQKLYRRKSVNKRKTILALLLVVIAIINLSILILLNLSPPSMIETKVKKPYEASFLSEQEYTTVKESVIIDKAKIGYAIVIGISNYPNPNDFLPWADDDAREFRGLLINEYNFKADNIIYIKDSQATEAVIDNAFNEISSEINSSDVFMFYYSGHGYNGGILQSLYLYDSSLYSELELNSQLNSLNCAEKYVVLDTCHSGGFIPSIQGSGRYIMTSCETTKSSYSTSELDNGIFTYYFLKSQKTATDLNGDEVLSMEEMFLYTYDKTVAYTNGLAPLYPDEDFPQLPQQNNEIAGEAILKPSIGTTNFTAHSNSLDYNFTLFGTGLIVSLDLLAVLDLYTKDYDIEDLTDNASTQTGFGNYNGTLDFGASNSAISWGVSAQISGNDLITVYYTSPHDNDGDGLTDVFEIYMGLDPVLYDSDFDGLNDYLEYYGLTNPLFPDSDLDGLLDGYEVFVSLTDPMRWDSDGDGISDGGEIESESDPLNSYSKLTKTQRDLIILLGVGISIPILATSTILGYKKYKRSKLEREQLLEPGKEQLDSIYCPTCGVALLYPKKFCPTCGKRLELSE